MVIIRRSGPTVGSKGCNRILPSLESVSTFQIRLTLIAPLLEMPLTYPMPEVSDALLTPTVLDLAGGHNSDLPKRLVVVMRSRVYGPRLYQTVDSI